MAIILDSKKPGAGLFTPQQKKQKQMLAILGLVLLATALIIYFGYFKNKKTSQLSLPADSRPGLSAVDSAAETVEPESLEKKIELLKQVKIEQPLFQEEKFNHLIVRGEFPLVLGEKGRENPFAPF